MLIGSNWKVESDDLNVVLSRKHIIQTGKKKGEEAWSVEGYYSTVSNALEALVEARVRGTELTDFKKVVAEIEAIKRDVSNIS